MERVRQAAAIAVRQGEDAPQVLLVQARRDPRHWIFPKGHVEPGETASMAAVRELAEEAGVEGEVVREVGTLCFPSGEEEVEVRYFLVRAGRQGGPREGRERRWCTREQALRLISFDETRRLLADTWPAIEALEHPAPRDS